MKNIINVKAIEKKNGKFMYVAISEDGGETVLRKTATRLYENAFYYEKPVASGSNGLASHFLYGKNKPSSCGEPSNIFKVITTL